MLVYCFTVRPRSNITIQQFTRALGKNVPQCSPDGEDGYLCCVDCRREITSVCCDYQYTPSAVHVLDVDVARYNRNYRIVRHPDALYALVPA